MMSKAEMNLTNNLLVSSSDPSWLATFIDNIRIAEHSRYLYQLQEPDTTTDESGGSDSWDSDESATSTPGGWQHHAQSASHLRSGRRRMSLLTGQYYDVPTHEHGYEHYDCGVSPVKSTKRRFFTNGAWDEGDLVDAELDARRSVLGGGRSLARTMEHGGQYVDIFDEDDEESMLVDA